MSVVSRAMMLAQSALIGFGQGFQPVCGFNYGAGLYHRVKEGFRFCVKWSTVFLTAVSVLGLVLAPQISATTRRSSPSEPGPCGCSAWPSRCAASSSSPAC